MHGLSLHPLTYSHPPNTNPQCSHCFCYWCLWDSWSCKHVLHQPSINHSPPTLWLARALKVQPKINLVFFCFVLCCVFICTAFSAEKLSTGFLFASLEGTPVPRQEHSRHLDKAHCLPAILPLSYPPNPPKSLSHLHWGVETDLLSSLCECLDLEAWSSAPRLLYVPSRRPNLSCVISQPESSLLQKE